jgi:hypothetical protein
MPSFEILKSEKNRDVLLVEGFLFWFDRATPKGRKYWKCIYCYRGYDGDVKNKCLSRVITSPNDPVAIICKNHNHCRDTVLVEHMKAFGSIRRLASSLRNTSNKASISPATSTSSIPEETNIPSTSEPLDLSIPTKRPASTKPPQQSPPKVPKKSKRALADVLETLYNRLQNTNPIPIKTTNENTTLEITEEKEKVVAEEKNLSYSVIEKAPSTLFSSPPAVLTQQPQPPLPPPMPPQVIDLSVTGQPGLANPNLPFRLSSSWLTLAAMSNIFASTHNINMNNNNITSQAASYIPQ